MIIINIIILYFLQIRHTDDFPSTGTRLVITRRVPIQRAAAVERDEIPYP